MTPAQRKHLSEAMKASHARRKAQRSKAQIVEVPIAAMPPPPRPATARVARGARKPNGRDLEALAQLIVACYLDLVRRRDE